MRSKLTLLALCPVAAIFAAACSSSSSTEPSLPVFEADPAESTQAEAPPSHDELENPGVIDVTIPAPVDGESSESERHMGVAAATATPVVVFVNGAGGTYYAGNDNAAAHTSSILSYYNRASATLPPAGYQGAQWQELLTCMRTIYAPYNVKIVDQKPTTGTYTEIVISNTWASNALGITSPTAWPLEPAKRLAAQFGM